MENKSICFYTVCHPMFRIGGAEVQTYLLAKEFARQGWKVYFLSRYIGKPEYEFDNEGLNVILYQSSNFFIFEWSKIFWQLLRINAHIFYYRKNGFDLGLLRMACAIRRKTRYVWATMHDSFCGRDAGTKKARSAEVNYRGIMRKLYGVKLKIEDFLFGFGARKASKIIVQNKVQQAIIADNFGRIADIVYNCHPVSRYNNYRDEVVVFIAAMKSAKRPELYCKLAGVLSDRRYRFVMIGQNFSDRKNAERLLHIVKESKVEYLGPMNLNTVNKYLDKAKILVNTSESEGFPNTFIQAWMRGVPVVSLSVDPDDLISTHKRGFVCRNNIDNLVLNVDLLMNDKDLWRAYSMRCYHFAVENFNIEKTVEKLGEKFLN